MNENNVSVSVTPTEVRGQKILQKIAAVQAEVAKVGKSGFNEHFRYAYMTEQDLIEVLRPVLREHGLAITASVVSESREGVLTKVMMRFAVYDTETTDCIQVDFPGYGEDKADKGVYKAMTGAHKYFCAKFFRIPVGDDPEETGTTKTTSTPARDRIEEEIFAVAKDATWTPAQLEQGAIKYFQKPMANLSEQEMAQFLAILQQKLKEHREIEKSVKQRLA